MSRTTTGCVVVAWRHRPQILEQPLRVVADGGDRLAGKGVRKQPHHDLAVLEHVGDAGGRAHIVLEHEKVALAGADEIDAGDMGIDPVRRLDAVHLGPVGRVEKHEVRRHEAGLDDLLVVVDVVEEDVDRLHPLNAAALDKLPFGAVEDARNEVERDQPLGRAAVGIDGEGDAEAAKQLLRRDLLGDERFDREAVEQPGKVGISEPHPAVGSAHLIEKSAGWCWRLAHPRFNCLRPLQVYPVWLW